MRWPLFLVPVALLGCGSSDDSTGNPSGGGDTDSGIDASPDADLDADIDSEPDADAEPDVSTGCVWHIDGGLGDDTPAVLPDPAVVFARFCGSSNWADTLEPATVGKLTGVQSGSSSSGEAVGTIYNMLIKPEHPFRLKTIRASFAKNSGPARLRLANAFGRSYIDRDADPSEDLIPPQEFEVIDPKPDQWVEIDVSRYGLLLEPTQHYALVYERIECSPSIVFESVPGGEASRAIKLVPNQAMPNGIAGNVRMELVGETMCRIDEADRSFTLSKGQPFDTVVGQYGVFTDLDSDGNVDMVVYEGGIKAFMGDGTGNFALPATSPFPDTPDHDLYVFADINNDGFVDAFAAAYYTPTSAGPPEDRRHRILLNNRSGVLTTYASSGVEPDYLQGPTSAAAFGDADGDGKLDLYWGNWLLKYPNPGSMSDVFLIGAGTGDFFDRHIESNVSSKPNYACYGVAWNDYNNDGYQDIWVGNYGYDPNLMWKNAGNATFTDVGQFLGIDLDGINPGLQKQGGNTFGGDFGDVNNDGFLDHYAANIAHPRYQPYSDTSKFYMNQGPPNFKFSEERAARGLIYDEGDVNAAFADFDHDGYLDLAIGSLYTGHYSRLYRNDGTGHFVDVTYETGVSVHDSVAVVWADVDHDGDLDLMINSRTDAPRVHLFINQVGQDKPWIQLDLRGVTSNRDGIGARVKLTAGGMTQIREVRAGGGHKVQSERIVHFGLGNATSIDSITVRWVGGVEETISGLAPGHRYLVVQGTGTGTELF